MKILLFGAFLTLLCGCVSIPKIVEQAGKDPATAFISIPTMRGPIKIIRTNPTNGANVEVSQEGSVSVNRPQPTSLEEHVRVLERLRSLERTTQAEPPTVKGRP